MGCKGLLHVHVMHTIGNGCQQSVKTTAYFPAQDVVLVSSAVHRRCLAVGEQASGRACFLGRAASRQGA